MQLMSLGTTQIGNQLGAKRFTFTLDHSTSKQCDADKLKMKDVTIKNCWVKGMHTSSLALLNSLLFMDTEYNFYELKDTCTIIKPFGKRVGVSSTDDYDG